MNTYTIASITLTLAILIGYINNRFIKMQTTIAIMSASLLISLCLMILKQWIHVQPIIQLVQTINFQELLINGMLSFLLFAGALTIDIHAFKNQKWEIAVLSTVSTVASGILIGFLVYYLFNWMGINLTLMESFLFGALISPTDPIAVLATFKQVGAPKALDVTVAGESLFNDGVGIVMFLTLYQLAFNHEPMTFSNVSLLFLRQAIGGIIYGGILGILANQLIKSTTDHKIEILLTIAVATGGYAFAQYINISGPLAMVVAGIIIGNHVRKFSMTKKGQETLDEFWELIDELLNAALFLLIGFELLLIENRTMTLTAALIAIPLVLLIRWITVAIPMSIFKIWRTYCPHTITILVWGGLRGGLAVALALTLPSTTPNRSILLAMTYATVAFAVIVQGLTVKPLIKLTKLH